jgi:hypothetical protein
MNLKEIKLIDFASRVSPLSLVGCVESAYISKRRFHGLTQIQMRLGLQLKMMVP